MGPPPQNEDDISKQISAIEDRVNTVSNSVTDLQAAVTDMEETIQDLDTTVQTTAENLSKIWIPAIPLLEGNSGKAGFVTTASSALGNGQAFSPFTLNADAANGTWITNSTTTGWIQIQMPYKIVPHTIAVKARPIVNRNITHWSLSSSNDAVNWSILIDSTQALLGSATSPSFFSLDTTPGKMKYFRFTIHASTGSTDVGVNLIQLYHSGMVTF